MEMLYWMFGPLTFLIFLGLVVTAVIVLVRLSNLSREVNQLRRRLDALGQPSPDVAQPSQPATPPVSTPTPEAPARRPVAPASMLKVPELNLEALIGGAWLNKIGVVLVLFAAGFFLKYAFDSRWIGETGRVMIGLIAGIVFLGLGEWYRRKGYQRFAQGLSGGGIGLFYLSIYAAFAFYHLIPQVPAFLFMIFVTAAGVALAVRYDARLIAMLASVGGFLTPVLLSTGVDNQIALFSYIVLLNVGILAVACFRNWPILNYQNFILTVTAFAAWSDKFYAPAKLWTTVFFLTLLFIVFALVTVVHNVIYRRKASNPGLILAFLNAGLYFAAVYFLLENKYDAYLGLYALAMGAAYVGLAYFTNVMHAKDRYLVWVLLGLAATFVTLAIPIQFKQNWITIGWAIEGAILVYIGHWFASRNTVLASAAILALVCFRLIVFDVQLWHTLKDPEYLFLLNKRTLSFVIGIAALLLFAYLTSQGQASESEKLGTGVALLAANVLAIVLLSAESYDYLNHLHFKENFSRNVLRNAQQMTLSIIWTLYATFLIVVGIWKKYQPLRYMALLLFGITIAKVFFIDLSTLARFYRILSFVVLGLILIAVSFLYQKYKDVLLGPSPAEEKAK